MPSSKSDILVVVLSQGLAAVGLLIGMRMQTEFITPEIFGAAALMVGYAAICIGLVSTPYLQAALRFYPEFASRNRERALKRHVVGLVSSRMRLVLIATVMIGGVLCALREMSFWQVGLIAVISSVDVYRAVELAFLNASRKQSSYGAWTVYEAWARPLMAVLFVHLFGASVEAVLSGYACASAISLLIYLAIQGSLTVNPTIEELHSDTIEQLADIRKYAKPLFPMGLVGIISSLSDRYVVGGLLGLHEAGIYSAVAGLISRPFLMTQNAIELAVRPQYFNAVSTQDLAKERQIYTHWLIFNAGAGASIVVLLLLCQDSLVQLLLGKSYAEGGALIPLLGIAQFFVMVTYSLNAYLYAHKHTRDIFKLAAVNALIALICLTLAGHYWGLRGIAAATVLYYFLLLIMTALCVGARLRHRRNV